MLGLRWPRLPHNLSQGDGGRFIPLGPFPGPWPKEKMAACRKFLDKLADIAYE
jgi:hypothetical protein